MEPDGIGRLGRIARARARLPANVRALGWVSFANDFASELAYPVTPLFLTATLGAPVAVIGLIEGIAEGVAVGLRGVAGALSDRTRPIPSGSTGLPHDHHRTPGLLDHAIGRRPEQVVAE